MEDETKAAAVAVRRRCSACISCYQRLRRVRILRNLTALQHCTHSIQCEDRGTPQICGECHFRNTNGWANDPSNTRHLDRNANSLSWLEGVRRGAAIANSISLLTISRYKLTVANPGRQHAIDTLAGTTRFQPDNEHPPIGRLYERTRRCPTAFNQSIGSDSEINFNLFGQDLQEIPIPRISADQGRELQIRRSRSACKDRRKRKVVASIHIS